MKTLTQLSAKLEERDWKEPHGVLQSVHVEAAPGFFVRITLGPAGLVEEVERNLRLSDSVIRYYSVKTEENVDHTAKTSSVTDETFASASVPVADEEAIATGQAGVRAFGEEDEEGGFDFEEAVFGSSDEPRQRKE